MEMTTTRAAILVLGAIALGMFCIGKVFSPVYVFINDTPSRVSGAVIGETPPNRQIDLAPERYAVLNAPLTESVLYRWEPKVMRTDTQVFDVVPTWNLTVLKIVWMSKISIAK